MSVSLSSLLIQETKAAIYNKAIAIAAAVGLPVSSWQPGDPTRSTYHVEAETLSVLEAVVVGFIRSAFLDYSAAAAATDDGAKMWLKINAEQTYGVTVPEATYATTDVVLTNGGGAFFDEEDLAPNAVTFRNTTSGKTYHNTTTGTLASGVGNTVTLTVVADEPGSDSSASEGEIDEIVTTMIGVSVTNPTAAIATDEQDPATTVAQCRDKLDMLSPNGAKGAYAFVARDPGLAGTNAVTRVRVYSDSDTGDVKVYLAGPSGGVSEPDRALVEEAILTYATPVCITPTVLAAQDVAVSITYSLWVYKSVGLTVDEIKQEVEDALEDMFSVREIGGDIIPPATTGALYNSLIESTIRGLYEQAFRVVVSMPVSDTPLANDEVATLGSVTGTIYLVVDG